MIENRAKQRRGCKLGVNMPRKYAGHHAASDDLDEGPARFQLKPVMESPQLGIAFRALNEGGDTSRESRTGDDLGNVA